MKKLLAKMIPACLVNFKLQQDPGCVEIILWINALKHVGYNIDIIINEEDNEKA